MCGIFGIISNTNINIDKSKELFQMFTNSSHRGPDNSIFKHITNKILFGFHRLCINDRSKYGDQPFHLDQYPHLHLICNGEIYNYKELTEQHNFTLESSSDCEIILHMYVKYGIEQTIKLLDGVFAFAIYNSYTSNIVIGRDPFGVRSLYISNSENQDSLLLASELKSIHNLSKNVIQFPPGHFSIISANRNIFDLSKIEFKQYYTILSKKINPKYTSYEDLLEKVNTVFTKAVSKRLLSDRPIGCLLSGGLDSSLVTALVAREFKKQNKRLHTFSIGLQGSIDLIYAQKVATHLNTIHHEVIVSEEELFNSIPECIKQIESYDTTTVRASTPMYLLCKYIKENTDIAVIYSGEGADEASGSYLYFQNAPTPQDFHEETLRLLNDLQYFDVLRSDKSTAGAGLEVRVPFLDKEFLDLYMSIPTEFKVSNNKIEKQFLRDAFSKGNLLPSDVLWRKKEAFSDGCSSKKRSWYTIIQENVNKLVSDSEFQQSISKFHSNPPLIKESYYYRTIFDKIYPNKEHLMPYYWLPKWCGDISDPSARVLDDYE